MCTLLSMLGSKTTLAVVRELSWGILGRGEGSLWVHCDKPIKFMTLARGNILNSGNMQDRAEISKSPPHHLVIPTDSVMPN